MVLKTRQMYSNNTVPYIVQYYYQGWEKYRNVIYKLVLCYIRISINKILSALNKPENKFSTVPDTGVDNLCPTKNINAIGQI